VAVPTRLANGKLTGANFDEIAAKTRGFYSWSIMVEGLSAASAIAKMPGSLALPTGIEPVFQP
jgi:hypothetical protein